MAKIRNKKECKHPEKLKGKPGECSPEQIKECHGEVKQHACVQRNRLSQRNWEVNMPIYEYLCTVCGTEFELMRSFGEASKPARCPKCNLKAQKLISGFACKTGSSIQVSPKPFRKSITESIDGRASKLAIKDKQVGTKGRKNVKQQEKKSEEKKK